MQLCDCLYFLVLEMDYQKIKYSLKEKEISSIGLIGGCAGELLFKYVSENKDSSIIEENLIALYELASTENTLLTYCSGLAGLSWLFNYFNEKEVVEVDMNEVFGETDEYLYTWMMQQINHGEYDYLHGAVGIGVYFLSRTSNEKYREYLSDLVDGLDKIAIKEEDGAVKFLSVLNHENGETGYNLSLSHGISSIIVFLTRGIEQDINKEKATALLNGCVKYLLKNRLQGTDEYYSIFPNSISEGQKSNSSRLAWCYGDLGIGIALYQAGVLTNNKEWEEFALEVLIKCTERRDLMQNGVLDAGLCHGAAGIGHIFHRMYRYSKDEVFKEAAQFWFDETKKMAIHEDGIAGYKAWHGKEGWVNETNLLVGISGIALALYCWENNIDPDWDRCLLLS